MVGTAEADRQAFNSSLGSDEPPRLWTAALRALWFAAKGDLDQAQALVDKPSDQEEAWVLAHLRRTTGDLVNARYWYAHAMHDVPVTPPDIERDHIVMTLLAAD